MNQKTGKAGLPSVWRFGFFIALTLCFILLTPSQSLATEFTGKVVGVKDGDSLIVRKDSGVAVEIRLWGIDAPEKRQAFSNASKRHLSNLAFGKRVRVLARDTDRYGRTVAEVILTDGRNVNQEMVKAGYAWWFRKYAPNDRVLESLESEARKAKRGLWADPHAVPPWEYRRVRRSR
jgi:endonuclease YncB( thermonuclease family)